MISNVAQVVIKWGGPDIRWRWAILNSYYDNMSLTKKRVEHWKRGSETVPSFFEIIEWRRKQGCLSEVSLPVLPSLEVFSPLFRIELGDLTHHNIKQLRLVNSIVFPVSYNDQVPFFLTILFDFICQIRFSHVTISCLLSFTLLCSFTRTPSLWGSLRS